MDDIKLIRIVEEQPILYDKRRADYRNKNKQNNTWDVVAKKLQQDVDLVKSRWLCIRQRFSRERLKRVSGADTTDEWKHMKNLKFLDPFVKRRKTISIVKNINEDSNVSLEVICKTEEEEVTTILSATSSEMLHSPYENLISPDSGSSTSRSAKEYNGSADPLETTPTPSSTICEINTPIEKNNTISVPASAPDPDDIFGQFVACQLRLSDVEEKKRKMKSICRILLE